MRLKTKLILLCAGLCTATTALLGTILYDNLKKDRLRSIQQNTSIQLQLIESSLNSFIEEVKDDLRTLVANELVRTRDDREFTNFLHAEESAFRYHYQEKERKIIALFNAYRLTHPYVSSVYMGRENGSFVRSHPRERPTRYDPRERPWYVLARANPNQVLETEAYPSLTTNDVNIGIVQALLDENGLFYGAVGIDITLANLSGFLRSFRTTPPGQLVLLDGKGTVLASQNRGILGLNIERHSAQLKSHLAGASTGAVEVRWPAERHFVYFSPPTSQGWRLLVLIPSREIGAQLRAPIFILIAGLAAGWLVLGTLILLGLHLLVLRPVRQFTQETGRVARTADLQRRVEVRSGDEIGALAASYNQMIDTLRKTQADLGKYRDHLEEQVKQRTGELQDANRRLKKEIAERIMVQQALLERETQYRDLVESANSIIFRWLPDGKVTFFNRFAQSFFGYNEKEIVGQNMVGTILGSDLSMLVQDIVARPEAHVRNVNENLRRNGERVWVAWSNKPMLEPDGQIREMLSIGIDITQLVRTERELRQTLEELSIAKERSEAADKLKSAFLATMSHELRTPLNSIIGFTGILLQGLVGPLNEEQQKQLAMVQGSAQHLLSLISDVLDISKIEAGQMTVVSEPVDLKASLQKVVQTIQPLTAKKGLELVVEISPELGSIRSDVRRLEQILLNILSNAVKFTERGRIVTSCHATPGEVVFQVTDTGIGMSGEELDRIFKPFQQIDTGLARKYEGTGLGLSICKRLVELMGGRIWVRSARDEGSTFSFSLPAEKDQP